MEQSAAATKSDGNVKPLAKDGYAAMTHAFGKSGTIWCAWSAPMDAVKGQSGGCGPTWVDSRSPTRTQ
jgi:hypothetical protein